MRNCLVALADTEPLMEKVMQYRFHDSSSSERAQPGEPVFIAAMSDVEGGNMEEGWLPPAKSSRCGATSGPVPPRTSS